MNTYEETMLIRTAECDVLGRWRGDAILLAMQEAAGAHAYSFGCGRPHLLERNTVWVISRVELRMERYPVIGETVRLVTWPMPAQRFFFPRWFTFYDETGAVLGHAYSLWEVLDLTERKLADPAPVASRMPDNSAMALPFEPGKRPRFRPADTDEAITRRALFSDLDVNGHVNNTRYVAWACDALGVDTMTANDLAAITVEYCREIRPGEDVELRLQRTGESFSLCGSADGADRFVIAGQLRPRT